MYSILNNYIRKVIISNTVMVFLILISLSSVIKLVEELRKIGEENNSIYKIIVYVVLSLPKDFELLFPMAIFLGSLLGLSTLELHNEFIAMQISGLSRLQIALSVIQASVPLLLLSIIFNEWIIPNNEKIICMYRNLSEHNTHVFPTNMKNIWIIDNNDFVCIERVISYNELLGVRLYNLNKKKEIEKIIYIKQAIFINKVWHLFDVNELDISSEISIIKKKIPYSEWNAMLTPHKLSMIIANPSVLSISKLYHCTRYLKKIGQNYKHHQIIFWNKISFPISGLVMTIMALSCTFGPLHKKKISIRLFIGSIVGFLFYILHQIFGILSIIYNISPIIGSILPSSIFLVISITIIWLYS